MSTDTLFDLLAILVFAVVPLVLTVVGLAAAIRSSSLVWRVVGHALAVGSSWVSLVTIVYVARCPSQQGEVCGEQGTGAPGDVGLEGVIGISIAYAVLVFVARRWKLTERPAGRVR